MSGFNSDIKTSMENSRNCLRRIARHDEKQFSKDSLVNVMEKFVKTVNAMDETILVPCRLMDRQVGDSTDIIQVPPKTSASYQINMTNNINGVKKHRHQTVHEFLNSADLFNIYSMLNSLKNDLLWTRNEDDDIINNTNVHTIMSQISICSTTSSLGEPLQQQSQQQQQQDEQQTKITSTSTMVNLQQQNGNSNGGVNNNSNGATQNTTSTTSTTTTTTKGHNRRPSTASMTSANSVSNLSDSESEISNENDSGMESEGNCNGSQSGGSTTGSSCSQQNLDKATELARQCRQHLAGLHRCLEQMTEAANYLTARYQSDVGPV